MAGLVRGHKGLVYPTNFAVSSDTATVQIGYPYQIPYTITPANATNQKINWTSSNTSIATVDNKGIITAVSTGTCIITGVYSYDGTTVTITVTTTEVHTTGVSLDKHSLELNEGGIDWLHATLIPSNTSYPGITWSSSDTNVATVNNSGTVTYVGGGTCTITVTTTDGGFTDTCSVTCLVKVESVELNEHSININSNGTYQLTAIVLPNNASDKSVIWSSSDTSIATVNSAGLVTYVGAGTCTITVTTTDGGFTDTCEVVCGIAVTGVSLNYSSGEVQAGSPLQLVATITPSDASNKNITWSSSNSSIATVSNNGLVTYVANGSCTITCTTVDGGFTATCSITASSFTPVDRCFGYTGAQQSITLKPHKYCLEVRGASGGYTSYCGKGGYSSGCITLSSEVTVYVYVGGCGLYGTGAAGGRNGGGKSGTYSSSSNSSGGGGGASDIRIGGNSLYHRRIVAGGGGGGGHNHGYDIGGVGGGLCGERGRCYNGGSTSYPTTQATQTSGASFGCGTAGYAGTTGGGGGGGWYGGGGTCWEGGSGGSGYVYTSATCSSAPSGYYHCTSYYLTNAYTCCGCCSFPTASGGTETGHSGCGCVRIRSL